MRCPYCGGLNSDRVIFCEHCGRDLRLQAPYHQPRQAPQPQGRPASVPSAPDQQSRQAPASQGRAAPAVPPQASPRVRAAQEPVAIPVPPAPPPPDPPAPFPPRSLADLHALEQGALPYDVVTSSIADGRKKIVRISYAKGVPWQQVATLLKAFKEQQEEKFGTILIQGVLEQDTTVYSFTNGQLRFDRNVRLGSAITNRYQIETGNGLEADSVRVVLTE